LAVDVALQDLVGRSACCFDQTPPCKTAPANGKDYPPLCCKHFTKVFGMTVKKARRLARQNKEAMPAHDGGGAPTVHNDVSALPDDADDDDDDDVLHNDIFDTTAVVVNPNAPPGVGAIVGYVNQCTILSPQLQVEDGGHLHTATLAGILHDSPAEEDVVRGWDVPLHLRQPASALSYQGTHARSSSEFFLELARKTANKVVGILEKENLILHRNPSKLVIDAMIGSQDSFQDNRFYVIKTVNGDDLPVFEYYSDLKKRLHGGTPSCFVELAQTTTVDDSQRLTILPFENGYISKETDLCFQGLMEKMFQDLIDHEDIRPMQRSIFNMIVHRKGYIHGLIRHAFMQLICDAFHRETGDPPSDVILSFLHFDEEVIDLRKRIVAEILEAIQSVINFSPCKRGFVVKTDSWPAGGDYDHQEGKELVNAPFSAQVQFGLSIVRIGKGYPHDPRVVWKDAIKDAIYPEGGSGFQIYSYAYSKTRIKEGESTIFLTIEIGIERGDLIILDHNQSVIFAEDRWKLHRRLVDHHKFQYVTIDI
jgi:hypothetical protein